MVELHARRDGAIMTSRARLALVVLAAFGACSLRVVVLHGYFGFLKLAAHDPWALQMLLDLVIACTFALGWLRRDARKQGIEAWPYVVATFLLGSIGLLAYAVRRGLSTSTT